MLDAAAKCKIEIMILVAEQAGVLPFLIFILVAVVVVFAIIYGAKAARKRDEGLGELARRLGGKLQPSGLLNFPELRFPHLGRTVTLKYTAGGENESTKTHLTIPWPNGRLRCEIFLEGPLSGLRKLIGMQDIEIGSPHFDRQFIITGNDEAAIKAFLSPDAQGRVLDLLRLNGGAGFSAPGLYLQIASGTLTVTKASYLTDIASVERFIKSFLEFYAAATSVSSAGIEFLDTVPTSSPGSPVATAPHCIVCGEPLAADLVTCRSCRTPHHRDCWQYFGGCATYACGGKQFVPKASGGR